MSDARDEERVLDADRDRLDEPSGWLRKSEYAISMVACWSRNSKSGLDPVDRQVRDEVVVQVRWGDNKHRRDDHHLDRHALERMARQSSAVAGATRLATGKKKKK